VARCAWWVELHDAPALVHWEKVHADHVYTFRWDAWCRRRPRMSWPPWRCVDADLQCVVGDPRHRPVHRDGRRGRTRADLAGAKPVHGVDLAVLQARLRDNLDRND
jgi:hypothetical protein